MCSAGWVPVLVPVARVEVEAGWASQGRHSVGRTPVTPWLVTLRSNSMWLPPAALCVDMYCSNHCVGSGCAVRRAAQLRHEAAEAFRAARRAMDGSDLEDDADVAGSLAGDAGDGRDRDAAHHVQFDLDDPLMGDEFTFGQQGRIQEDDGIDPAVANGLMGGNNRPLPSSAHQIVEDLDVAFKAFSKLYAHVLVLWQFVRGVAACMLTGLCGGLFTGTTNLKAAPRTSLMTTRLAWRLR